MSGASPTVSVVIPTYNRTSLLLRAVASVRAQTFNDWELIVVDDGSSEDIAGALASVEDPRIRLIRHGVNRGAPAARNTGLAEVRGEWVAFLDSDDEWLPQKLAKQLVLVRRNVDAPVLVYTGFEKIGWLRQPSPPTRRGMLFEDLLAKNFIGTCSTPLISVAALRQAGGFDPELKSSQDWDLWVRLARLGPIDFVPETLVWYHHQEDSITMNRAGVIAGNRYAAKKWAVEVARLPASKRAQYYLRLGINYYWARAFGLASIAFLRSVTNDPHIVAELIDFLLIRRFRRPKVIPTT